MRLTAFTDYTLRTLMYLAVEPGRQATVGAIAQAYGISEAHLTKVVHRLAQAGDIETLRGKHGGIRLARPPEAIGLGAVVRRSEPDMDLVACFAGPHRCAICGACGLQGALRQALAAFLAELDRYTLADLIAPRRRLADALGLPARMNAAPAATAA